MHKCRGRQEPEAATRSVLKHCQNQGMGLQIKSTLFIAQVVKLVDDVQDALVPREAGAGSGHAQRVDAVPNSKGDNELRNPP